MSGELEQLFLGSRLVGRWVSGRNFWKALERDGLVVILCGRGEWFQGGMILVLRVLGRCHRMGGDWGKYWEVVGEGRNAMGL